MDINTPSTSKQQELDSSTMEVNMASPSTSEQEIDPSTEDINTPSSSNQEDLHLNLADWSKDELYDFYLGLRYHGYHLKEIQKRIPNKTLDQIQSAINYFKLKLKDKSDSNLTPRQRRRYKPLPQKPLSKWAEVLSQMYHYKELQTECAAAVRIIGDYEDFPHPSSCSGIDFRKIYHYMADAMEGKLLPDDPNTREVFYNSLIETGSLGKNLIPKNELEDILNSVSTNCTVNIPRPTKDGGLVALRYLAAQRNYNPLNIPEKYLLHPSISSDLF